MIVVQEAEIAMATLAIHPAGFGLVGEPADGAASPSDDWCQGFRAHPIGR